jgi:serine/threonine protein kinase
MTNAIEESYEYNRHRRGSQIDGRYTIQQCLGRSENTVIYKCIDEEQPHRVVVVKVLSPALVNNAETTARFCKEFVAASKLSHPNILQT